MVINKLIYKSIKQKKTKKISKFILFYQNIMFWLSYECFSILCNVFLPKSVISSNNSCQPAVNGSSGHEKKRDTVKNTRTMNVYWSHIFKLLI